MFGVMASKFEVGVLVRCRASSRLVCWCNGEQVRGWCVGNKCWCDRKQVRGWCVFAVMAKKFEVGVNGVMASKFDVVVCFV